MTRTSAEHGPPHVRFRKDDFELRVFPFARGKVLKKHDDVLELEFFKLQGSGFVSGASNVKRRKEEAQGVSHLVRPLEQKSRAHVDQEIMKAVAFSQVRVR